MAFEGEKVLGTKGDALQGSAEALDFDVGVDGFGFLESFFAEGKSEGVVGRAEGFETVEVGAGELDGGDGALLELGVEFGDGGEGEFVGHL